jgi:hypothetical protein
MYVLGESYVTDLPEIQEHGTSPAARVAAAMPIANSSVSMSARAYQHFGYGVKKRSSIFFPTRTKTKHAIQCGKRLGRGSYRSRACAPTAAYVTSIDRVQFRETIQCTRPATISCENVLYKGPIELVYACLHVLPGRARASTSQLPVFMLGEATYVR